MRKIRLKRMKEGRRKDKMMIGFTMKKRTWERVVLSMFVSFACSPSNFLSSCDASARTWQIGSDLREYQVALHVHIIMQHIGAHTHANAHANHQQTWKCILISLLSCLSLTNMRINSHAHPPPPFHSNAQTYVRSHINRCKFPLNLTNM